MFEVRGSSALQQETVIEVPQVEQEPRRQRPVRSKTRKRKLTGRKKAVIVLCIFAVSAMAAVVLILMANLNTNYRILSRQKAELANIEAQVEQLASETEGASVVAVTEEQAAELGLYKAGKDQVVYITLDDADSGRVLAEDDSNVGINAFFNKVKAIAEYFY